MAEDTRKIVVEIISTQGEGETTPPKPTDNDGKVKRNEKEQLKSVLLNQAYNQAKKLVVQSVNSTLSRYYNMKEDYMLENNVNAIKTIIGKTSSFATTVAGGAMIGGVAGGVIAGVGWLGSEAINVSNMWKDTYAQINATNYNKTFTKSRLGLIDGGRGTEN